MTFLKFFGGLVVAIIFFSLGYSVGNSGNTSAGGFLFLIAIVALLYAGYEYRH